MADYYQAHVTRNCLAIAYAALRPLGRFVEGSHVSPYKQFFEKVRDRKLEGEVPNSEVESYYLNKMSEAEFVGVAEKRLCGGNGGDSDLVERLLSTVWNTLLATPTNAQLCTDDTLKAGRQLWEIFIRLDTEGHKGLHAEDVTDLTLRIFKANDHFQKPEAVMSWFSNKECVGFWEYFKLMVTQYRQLLQSPVVTELYDMISTEMIREGKLTKKGHIVPNWKGRWFTLRATTLTYREAKDALILKTIVINDKTQVQNMPETKGHLYRFRVLDGSSATPTEISATDESTMREWMAYIKLAIKMNQIEGRNFLHKYRLALNSFPRSFFSQSPVSPAFTTIPQARNTTSPTHKGLKSSQSVPLGEGVGSTGRENKVLPTISQRERGTDSPDGSDMNDPPPVPPQRFDPVVESEVRKNPQRSTEQATGKSEPRRRSSLDSTDIEHIHVDGDLEYAVVTKVPKKKKPKGNSTGQLGDKPPDPPPHRTQPAVKKKSKSAESPPVSSHTSTPPPPPPHSSTPPQQIPPRRILGVSSLQEAPCPPPRSPHTSPVPVRKGYIELQFENGNLTPGNETPPTKPADVPTKFGYTQLQFEGTKEKEKELEEGGVKTEKAPPPPPRQGGMAKSVTESNVQNPHSSSNGTHSHSNGAHSRPKASPRSKPTSLPDLKAQPKKNRELDYAEVVFNNNPAVSPSATRRILATPTDEPVSGSSASRVSYATVILTNPEPKPQTSSSKPPKSSGYEIVDFDPNLSKDNKKASGYVNFDFASGSRGDDDSQSILTNGPKVAGSARLINTDPKKPRAAPRKMVGMDKAPVPPARTTSTNT